LKFNYFQAASHADKLTEASNTIALVLAGNTPFYPLYLYFILGRTGLPWLLLAGAALPFFCATLFIAKHNGLRSRIWLSLTATLNSIYVTWLLGQASATALFLIPCIGLAVLSFRRRERLAMALCTALPFILFYFLQDHFPPPPAVYSPKAYHSLLILNEVSVASITAVLAYVFAKAHREDASRAFSDQSETL
jgi:hypothetical protein